MRRSPSERQDAQCRQPAAISGAPLYWTRDHVRSVRDLVNANGVSQAHHDYDPFGAVITSGGGTVDVFQFTGVLAHVASGLSLTWSRAYDSTGRWLSEDPIALLAA